MNILIDEKNGLIWRRIGLDNIGEYGAEIEKVNSWRCVNKSNNKIGSTYSGSLDDYSNLFLCYGEEGYGLAGIVFMRVPVEEEDDYIILQEMTVNPELTKYGYGVRIIESVNDNANYFGQGRVDCKRIVTTIPANDETGISTLRDNGYEDMFKQPEMTEDFLSYIKDRTVIIDNPGGNETLIIKNPDRNEAMLTSFTEKDMTVSKLSELTDALGQRIFEHKISSNQDDENIR